MACVFVKVYGGLAMPASCLSRFVLWDTKVAAWDSVGLNPNTVSRGELPGEDDLITRHLWVTSRAGCF